MDLKRTGINIKCLDQGIQNQLNIHALHVWGGGVCLFVLWFLCCLFFPFSFSYFDRNENLITMRNRCSMYCEYRKGEILIWMSVRDPVLILVYNNWQR